MSTESEDYAGELEVPEALLHMARGQYELARLRGRDPDFEDFLCDTIVFEPTYQVNGAEVDMETGQVSESGETDVSDGFSHSREEGDE